VSDIAASLPPTAQIPSVEVALTLADDLLRVLAQHIGDGEAIAAHMRRWVDHLGPSAFGAVCMAAVLTTFTDCLTVVAGVPPGASGFTAPTGDTDD
jgi:hypothetical protein